MATITPLNPGATANDGTGDTLRAAAIIINANEAALNADKIEAVEDDTAPVLGGDLDVAGNAIVSSAGGNIPITPDTTGKIILDGITLNLDGGTNGQVLKHDGAAGASWQDDATGGGGGGLANVVEDLTPQLGGDLDVNARSIVSASGGNIVIAPDTTGRFIADGLTYPAADGTAGQVLQTNGSGVLSFTTAGGGDMLAATYDPTAIAASPFARANHTGSQTLSTISDAGALAAGSGAGDVAVVLSPTNYSVGSSSVEAHFTGINTSLGTKSNVTRVKNRQTGTSYTLALVDNGALLSMDNASPNTVTIPLNATVAFPFSATTSAQTDIVQKGAGVTTITAVTGVTLNGVDGGSATITERYGMATLVKDDTDAWWLGGSRSAIS